MLRDGAFRLGEAATWKHRVSVVACDPERMASLRAQEQQALPVIPQVHAWATSAPVPCSRVQGPQAEVAQL